MNYKHKYFESRINKHPLKDVFNTEDIETFKLVDYFYASSKDTKYVEQLEDNPSMQFAKKYCRRNISQSLDTSAAFLKVLSEQVDEDKEESDSERQSRIRRALKSDEFKQVKEDLEENDALARILFPGTEEGGEEDAVDEMKCRLFNDERLKAVLKLFGALYANNNKVKRERRVFSPTARSEVVVGNHIPSLLNNEMLKFLDDDFKDLFMAKYSQRGLLQYKREKPNNVDRGDVEIMIDVSESMMYSTGVVIDGYTYTRMQCAQAAALAMCKSLHDDGRGFKVTKFHVVDSYSLVTSSESSFGDVVKSLINMSYTINGTSISSALLHTVKSDSHDVIIMTDAEDYIDQYSQDKFKELKKARYACLHITDYIVETDTKKLMDYYIAGSKLAEFETLCEEVVK